MQDKEAKEPDAASALKVNGTSAQLHGFCNASELAYTRVVYLRAVDQNGSMYISLVMAKAKVAAT